MVTEDAVTYLDVGGRSVQCSHSNSRLRPILRCVGIESHFVPRGVGRMTLDSRY
jgi:hypothetical protein